MNRVKAFAVRNAKEILRDPLTAAFGLGFPLVLILLMSAIQANIPVPLFEIGSLAPAVTVFGLAFMSLFSATLIAKDRESALLRRLYTTPMTSADFIAGYMLPMIPLSAAQTAVCYATALPLGLPLTTRILWAMLANLPASLLFISLGLLCGSVLNGKQVGGICGALLTNLTGWLSGAWFDLDLVGGGFKKAADTLPFVHAVELERAVLTGSGAPIGTHLLIVCLYACVCTAFAVILFLRQMKRQ